MVDGLSSMPAESVRAVEAAVELALAESLADAGRDARSGTTLEVISFLRALCFGRCPHGCPARAAEPAADLFDRPAPWEAS